VDRNAMPHYYSKMESIYNKSRPIVLLGVHFFSATTEADQINAKFQLYCRLSKWWFFRREVMSAIASNLYVAHAQNPKI
jgi:hypothetical protein